MHNYTFDCGCCVPLIEERSNGALPKIELDPDNFPDCAKVWELLSSGKTKGIWQLESGLGSSWCKKLKPENIEHLAALGAILRPGCLNVYDEEGHSVTLKYCLRKNAQEEIVYKYECLRSILEKTYGLMIYQEQMLKIAELICDFSKLEQDALRKAVGKKDQSALSKVGINFIEKGITKGLLSKEQVESLFEDIRQSGRYLFNKSHAISYALKGYQTAYIKSHIHDSFFASWLLNAHADSDPRQERRELVEDAKNFNVKIETPDLLSLESNISTDGLVIKFGLSDIKGIGEKQVEKLKLALVDKNIQSWKDFLYYCSDIPSSTAIKGWISAGALKWTKISRARMLKEYEIWSELKDGEKEWILKNSTDNELSITLKLVAKTKKEGGGCHTKGRVEIVKSAAIILDQKASSDEDHPNQIVDMEEASLGIAISCSRIDGCDVSMADTTCKQISDGKAGRSVLAVEVKEVKELKIKNGKNTGSLYARGIICDDTSNIQFVIWGEQWGNLKQLFKVKNTLIVEGQKDTKFDSLIIKKAYQL